MALVEFNSIQKQPNRDLHTASGLVKMRIPAGGAHMRNYEVKLPFFLDDPEVTVTLVAPSGDIERIQFQVTDITLHAEQTYLGCKITAANTDPAKPVDAEIYCNYHVTGGLAE